MYLETQKKINEVEALMGQNIEKVFERGEKLQHLSSAVEAELIEVHDFRNAAKESYVKAENENFALRYGAPITPFTACAFFMMGLVRALPWPLLIISFVVGAGLGVAISCGLYKAHDIVFRAKLFAESLLPGKPTPTKKQMPHMEHKPGFLPSKGAVVQKAVKQTAKVGATKVTKRFGL